MTIGDEERGRQRELLVEYFETRDLAVRDQLVAANLRLALHLARRFSNRGVSTDDLEQVASLGLLRAIDRFDPGRGLEFSTFATPTILGELKRHFRDRGWAVRVPRRIQELHIRLNTLVAELTHQLGRSPTIAELADRGSGVRGGGPRSDGSRPGLPVAVHRLARLVPTTTSPTSPPSWEATTSGSSRRRTASSSRNSSVAYPRGNNCCCVSGTSRR